MRIHCVMIHFLETKLKNVDEDKQNYDDKQSHASKQDESIFVRSFFNQIHHSIAQSKCVGQIQYSRFDSFQHVPLFSQSAHDLSSVHQQFVHTTMCSVQSLMFTSHIIIVAKIDGRIIARSSFEQFFSCRITSFRIVAIVEQTTVIHFNFGKNKKLIMCTKNETNQLIPSMMVTLFDYNYLSSNRHVKSSFTVRYAPSSYCGFQNSFLWAVPWTECKHSNI